MANSNIIPSRRNKEYSIGFDAELRFMSSKIDPTKEVAYWVAENDSDKNVILLHGFTRTSDKLQRRAEIYWNLGYNLYFVDNLGHGYSSNQLYPSGYRYSREVKHLIQHEKIKKPIIHGLSMGAIAANVIAQLEPELTQAIVCEALAKDFDNIYRELLRYLGIPYLLFPWLNWLSKQLNWRQFEELGLDENDYHPTEIECPIFLIHSANDPLFRPEDHFWPLSERLKKKNNAEIWLVEEARHTDMDQDDKYEDKLTEFVKRYG